MLNVPPLSLTGFPQDFIFYMFPLLIFFSFGRGGSFWIRSSLDNVPFSCSEWKWRERMRRRETENKKERKKEEKEEGNRYRFHLAPSPPLLIYSSPEGVVSITETAGLLCHVASCMWTQGDSKREAAHVSPVLWMQPHVSPIKCPSAP